MRGFSTAQGAIDEHTPVVTTIHDEQLVDDIPTDKLLRHDVPVDIICTPTRIIHTNTAIPKPEGIYWDLLSPQKLAQVKVLRDLKARLEAGLDEPLPTGPDEELPPLAVRAEKERLRKGRGAGGGGRGGEEKNAAAARGDCTAERRRLFLTGLGVEDGWRDVKRRVEEVTGAGGGEGEGPRSFNVKMLQKSKEGDSRAALITFTKAAAAAAALEAIGGGGQGERGGLKAEWARGQPGQSDRDFILTRRRQGSRGGGGGSSENDATPPAAAQ